MTVFSTKSIERIFHLYHTVTKHSLIAPSMRQRVDFEIDQGRSSRNEYFYKYTWNTSVIRYSFTASFIQNQNRLSSRFSIPNLERIIG